MVGFYHKFCKKFTVVAEPLMGLLQKKHSFTWWDDQQQAFSKVKMLLTTAPVLAIPNFKKPFIMYVDASDLGEGVVLMQEDVHRLEHPICYFLRKFNNAQRSYSSSEKEALGLIYLCSSLCST